MLTACFRVVVAATILSTTFCHAQAGELVGKPIKVNPPSDAAGTVISALLTIDRNGGFGAVWGKDTDGQPGQDALFVRFYDNARAPAGRAVRYDAKTGDKSPRSLYFQQPILLSGTTVLQPWNVVYADDTSSPLLARLFRKERPVAGYKTVSTDRTYSQSSLQLRDGRGILTLPGIGSGKPVGQFIQPDGSNGALIPFSEIEPFGAPQSLKTGFVRTRFEDGAGTLTFYLAAKIYDENGAQIGGDLRLTPDFPYSEIRGAAVIGLENGNLFVSRCTALPQAGRCKLMGQLHTAAGVAIADPKVLLSDVSTSFAFRSYLPDGGFVISTRETTSSGAKVTYYRFDQTMKATGRVVEKRPGGNRDDLAPQLMTDGRIVSGYLLDKKTVTIRVVQP